MTTTDTILSWRGQKLYDRDGDKIGTIDEIYVDDATDRPEWGLVSTGLFGTSSTFIPLAQATQQGDQIRVPFEKSHVKDAPDVKADGHLSPDEEARLFRHYGLDSAEIGSTGRATEGHDARGRDTDDAMTRSEEEVSIATEQRPKGKARLRKHVTTDHVQATVPVEREEVRVEREPITDANVDEATSGPALSEEEHEVTLHEEEVSVDKRTVPKERVRLDKETVTDEREVSEDARKEEIVLEDQDETAGRR